MDGVITKYLYDGLNIIAEMDANNNITKTYTHNLAIDDPLAVTTNGQTYYYHKDGLGSVVALSDSTGTVVQTYTYDSFGNITNQTGSLIQPYTFTGREYDPESGLYYLRARELDSKTGTFTQKDPIGFAGGDVNLFRYVGNNPIKYIDPLGLAYFAKRPLKDLPWIWLGSSNSLDDYFNTEASHEQLFFEDEKSVSNMGFFDDGTLKMELNPKGYRDKSEHYNDCVMRKAVKNVPLRPYSLLGKPGKIEKYNCQDWAENVRKEYRKLQNDPLVRKECGCK